MWLQALSAIGSLFGGGKGEKSTPLLNGAIDKGLNQPSQIGPGAGMGTAGGLGVGGAASTPAMSMGGAESANLSGKLQQQAADTPSKPTEPAKKSSGGMGWQDAVGLIAANRGNSKPKQPLPSVPESQPIAGAGAQGGAGSILDTILSIINSGAGTPPTGGIRP